MKVLVCLVLFFASVFAAPGNRIIGGQDADRGVYTYQISIQWCFLGICQHSCGGSIISSSWIVTAGHCVTEMPSVGSLEIIAGILNLDDDNTERQTIKVTEKIVHPDYEGGVNPNDVALLKLESDLVFNSQIQPISLPSAEEETVGTVTLTGWGSVGGSLLFPQMPNTLQTVDLPILDIKDCDDALTTILDGPHPLGQEENICTGPLTGGLSACSGDSGGPLVQNEELVGIVSWGITPCGSVGAPSVYTKVSHYVDWINDTIA